MYKWSAEVLFFSPEAKDCEMMSDVYHQYDHHVCCAFAGSDQLSRKATSKRRSSLASESFHTEGVFGGWTCCMSCGRFTRGFRLFGLLFALLICTTKNARTTMAPRKAKTGIVCPTSWLYRPGIIPPGMSHAPLSPGDSGLTWGRFCRKLGRATLSRSIDSNFWCFQRLLGAVSFRGCGLAQERWGQAGRERGLGSPKWASSTFEYRWRWLPSIRSGRGQPSPDGGRCRFSEWLRLGGITP